MTGAVTGALENALGGRAAVVHATGIESVAAVRAAPRGGLVLLVIAGTVPKLDRAMLLAALGPLAEELAPTTRLAALEVGEGADPAAVVAAGVFLAGATSTTGQVLRVG